MDGICQWRSVHPIAKRASQARQVFRGVGQARGNLHILIWTGGDQLWQADVVRMLTPTRDTWRSPASVTTGNPIHNASQVVVVPL